MRGTLVFEDIGSGSWTLVTNDGKRYTLDGDIPRRLANKTVQVEGEVSEGGGFGFAMSGDPVIMVTSIKAA